MPWRRFHLSFHGLGISSCRSPGVSACPPWLSVFQVSEFTFSQVQAGQNGHCASRKVREALDRYNSSKLRIFCLKLQMKSLKSFKPTMVKLPRGRRWCMDFFPSFSPCKNRTFIPFIQTLPTPGGERPPGGDSAITGSKPCFPFSHLQACLDLQL